MRNQRWMPPGVHLPQHQLDLETVAAIIRITGGNFRLLNRLLAPIGAGGRATPALIRAISELL
jgi:hypothetical protein